MNYLFAGVAATQCFKRAKEHDDPKNKVEIESGLSTIGCPLGNIVWQSGLTKGDECGSHCCANGAE